MATKKPGETEDLDQTVESELQRLQKQLRKMEKDRVIYIEEKKCKNIKKIKIIDTLQSERNILRDQLKAIQEGPHAKRTNEMEREMQMILMQKDHMQKNYDDQKSNLWELEGHIKKMEKEIRKLQENDLTEKMYKDELQRIERCISKLENQLDVVNKRCGEVMAENANLRQIIDHMLLERTNFNDMWQKMVNKLELGKRYIIELIDQSTAAYDQREELCNKIQNLREKGITESSVHMQEMRELQRKLDHDAKLQQFFSIKGNRRQNADLEIREAQKKHQLQEQFQTQIDNYQKLLDSMMEISGEQTSQSLADYFRKQEDENFALFSYVNELSYEVETLNEGVQQIQDDIDKQKGENESKEKSQLESVDILEREYYICKGKATEAYEIQKSADNKLTEMLSGIEKIFKLIRCGDTPILELLGVHKSVITIYNVKLFLGIIRRKSNLIINCINMTQEQPVKILAKKDRVPKFNIKDK